MEGINLLEVEQWKPFAQFSEHPFFTINAETVLYTWLLLGILAGVLLLLRAFLIKKTSLVRFTLVSSIENFSDMCTQTLGSFSSGHVIFVGSIFIFIVLCNAASALPWFEEPTKDLNTTLSLGLISFMYTQWFAVKANGLWAYIKDFFSPFFLMFPLNVIGKLASIVSISFRLFGNIFGGATISSIYFGAIKGSLLWETVGIALGLNLTIIFFFGLFEAFLQAFVFAMLTLTYLSIAIQGEGH